MLVSFLPLAVASHRIQSVTKNFRPWRPPRACGLKTPGREKQLPELSNPPRKGWLVGRRRTRRAEAGGGAGEWSHHALAVPDFERAHTMRKAMPKPLNDNSQGDSEVDCLMLIGTEVLSSSVRIFSTADCVVTKIAFPHANNSLPSNTPSR